MLKSAKVLFDGLKTVKEELNDKYSMLTDCINLHNILVDDYENNRNQLHVTHVIEIQECFENSIEYLTRYVNDLNEVNEQVKGCIALNPVVNILRIKTYNLEVEIKEILNEVIATYDVALPFINEYKKEIH